MTAAVDTAMQVSGLVQSALDQADSLKGTLKCLDEASGYLNGIIEFVNEFANVSIQAIPIISIRCSVICPTRSTRYRRLQSRL